MGDAGLGQPAGVEVVAQELAGGAEVAVLVVEEALPGEDRQAGHASG